jgi:predicted neutral ceramidase superfamily lipid hydrolase
LYFNPENNYNAMFIFILIPYLLLFLVFALAGIFKLVRTKEQIISGGGKWAEEFQPTTIKLIGAAECILAITLALNFFVFSNPTLTILTSSMMALIMLGASILHIRRKEYPLLAVALVMMLLAVFILWLIVRS